MELDDIALANALADDARAIARRHFRVPLAVEHKADHSPVTIADLEIERALRERLATLRPGDGILGEEQGRTGMHRPRIWSLDPIDGTKSFITGSPLFGTLIALVDHGTVALGVVELPALGERYVAAAGATVLDGSRRCSTRRCRRLAEAVLYVTGPEQLADWPALDAALTAAVGLRRYGGDCYAYCQLALGFVDLVIETGLQPYDFLALVALVEGAGGVITDWAGQPLGAGSGDRVVAAATPQLHAEALALIAEHAAARAGR